MEGHSKWTDIDLDTYRGLTDPEVDRLVESILPTQGSEPIGRLGYNTMLLLADKLAEDPELIAVPDSQLCKQLKEMPKDLVSFFEPMEAPDWVDVEKLKLASKVWQENTFITLIALYAASLPACYLMKNGIPALYQTEKLREHKYIFQRIYETGLMLDATMDQNGINIIEDAGLEEEKLLLQSLESLQGPGQWRQQGRCFCQTSGSAATAIDPGLVYAEMERLRGRPKRYIWGKGYIAAKKVRFLHASMRFMLMRPNLCRPCGSKDNPQSLAEALSHRETPWDRQKYGDPVNQEDLAYTLLTFGLVIPQALSHWGVPMTHQQKEAFLHQWRLIGHIMGVNSDLLTDDWEEAEALFSMIQQRQAGSSEEGRVLTEALMGFLEDYLPHTPGIAHRLSAALMIGQLGLNNASYLLDEKLIKDTTCIWRKPIYTLAGWLFKIYLFFQTRYFNRFKYLGGITSQRLHQASEMLIDSWRDGYTRRPFFVPVDEKTWVRQAGIDVDFSKRLTIWRRKLFAGLSLAFAFLVVAVFAVAAALPSGLLWGWTPAKVLLITAGGSWLTSLLMINFRLPMIFRTRPTPPEHPTSR